MNMTVICKINLKMTRLQPKYLIITPRDMDVSALNDDWSLDSSHHGGDEQAGLRKQKTGDLRGVPQIIRFVPEQIPPPRRTSQVDNANVAISSRNTLPPNLPRRRPTFEFRDLTDLVKDVEEKLECCACIEEGEPCPGRLFLKGNPDDKVPPIPRRRRSRVDDQYVAREFLLPEAKANHGMRGKVSEGPSCGMILSTSKPRAAF